MKTYLQHLSQLLLSSSSLSAWLKPEKARHRDIVNKLSYAHVIIVFIKDTEQNQVVISVISSHIQSETPQKRRAESAGTFIIASEILKPRISHSRESRLSKMLLVFIKSTCEDFTYIFAGCRRCRPFPGLRRPLTVCWPVVTSCRNTTAVMFFCLFF